nr:E3 ubiquitin ligase SCF complex SKP1 subunit [Cryptomonas curvata]|mmetsp:Transcript_21817/g.45859  ORF Transcript_21817/g.45859 Transcript_21817/m.45859 type:complete len:147 (+) Transcript_21817:78-518(+)
MENTAISLILISKEKEHFKVEIEIALISNFLKTIYDEFREKSFKTLKIPLYNIEGRVLTKIIEYCRFEHKFSIIKKVYEEKLADYNKYLYSNMVWVNEFLKVNKHMIIQIINAASYLEIESLLLYSTQIIASNLVKKYQKIKKYSN